MTKRPVRSILAAAVLTTLAQAAAGGNLLTNGDFEAFVGPFPDGTTSFNGPVTTGQETWDKWLVWPRFESVGDGTLIDPTAGPFPTGWTGDNFAQHHQAFTDGTDDDGDYTDQIKQGIDGSRVIPGVPVSLSFKYINSEPGRLVRVEVYGIDGNQVWSEFASFPCQYPQFGTAEETCTLLYSADMPVDYNGETLPTWKSFSGQFTPAASHDAIAVGITIGGNKGYARGVDDVVLNQDIPVPVDIKPTSCPNPLNVGSKGVLPVAILGTGSLDVTTIDPATLQIAGVAPLRWSMEDVATPYVPYVNKPLDAYACTEYGPDGYLDLVLHFDTREVATAIGEVTNGEVIKLPLDGSLLNGTPILGEDIVRIIAK